MSDTYLIRTENLRTIARDTPENWKETVDFLRDQGIDFDFRRFSDYEGDTITSDMIYYYHHNPDECPVVAPMWAI